MLHETLSVTQTV